MYLSQGSEVGKKCHKRKSRGAAGYLASNLLVKRLVLSHARLPQMQILLLFHLHIKATL